MITGFNHNIKYRGLIFHVQTEDSGEERAHIITHLFIGGNIIITVRNSYKNVVNAPQMRSVVKSMMEQQHKMVLKNLLNSEYDAEIDKMLEFMNKPIQKNKDTSSLKDKKGNLNIIKQTKSESSAHLVEDKQKSILSKSPKNTEESLDDLILSFLEENL